MVVRIVFHKTGNLVQANGICLCVYARVHVCVPMSCSCVCRHQLVPLINFTALGPLWKQTCLKKKKDYV